MAFLLMNSGPGPAAFNMALDEALLEFMPRLRAPVLRLYGWTEPAASFGYFQKFSEVERATMLRPLVRRPTGGGLVPHDADWTYSAVFPVGNEWYSLKAQESYRRIHEWIRLAFAKLKISAELALFSKSTIANRQSVVPHACFIGHEKSDVLWHGKKIAGAAQRRNKQGLLIQGSIQPPPVGMVRGDFETAMSVAGAEAFSIEWDDFGPDERLRARTEELAANKYSQPAYNRKR